MTNLSNILLTSLALGNWGNTPSAPNDPDAPSSSGNEGELRLEHDGSEFTYLVQSARFHGGTLNLDGESLNGSPQFVLTAELSDSSASDDLGKIRGQSLRVAASGSKVWIEESGDFSTVTGGVLTVTNVTGSGPWEIDATLQLNSAEGAITGTLSAKVH